MLHLALLNKMSQMCVCACARAFCFNKTAGYIFAIFSKSDNFVKFSAHPELSLEVHLQRIKKELHLSHKTNQCIKERAAPIPFIRQTNVSLTDPLTGRVIQVCATRGAVCLIKQMGQVRSGQVRVFKVHIQRNLL